MTKIAFIGAGSTVFMKNLIGDALSMPALAGATIALMDIDPKRLAESEMVCAKMIATLGVPARLERSEATQVPGATKSGRNLPSLAGPRLLKAARPLTPASPMTSVASGAVSKASG